MQRLARTLRGIARKRTDRKRERPPLTTDLLKRVLGELRAANPRMGGGGAIQVSAALTAGVYGLLRISEVAPAKANAHDPAKDTRGCDVHFFPSEYRPKYYTIHLRTSKTDVFRRATTIRVFATGSSDCPVQAMATWMAIRRAGRNAPLFQRRKGRNLTRQRLTHVLRNTLERLGFEGKAYASHSLRAGGAVSLAAAGYGTETIMLLGRWKSASFMVYLAMSNHTARGAQRSMAQVGPGDITERERERYRNRYEGG